jgi:uncharacterized protein involved in exopolysaccharide biosynthesis
MRNSDNDRLLASFRATLLDLGLKRASLGSKFEPDYRTVQDLDSEIREAQATLAGEAQKPLREQITDGNPTYFLLDRELAESKAELAALQANASATDRSLDDLRRQIRTLTAQEQIQQDLVRTVRANEEYFFQAVQKREEARISGALEGNAISNVVLAVPPATPVLPDRSVLLICFVGGLFCTMFSIAVAFTVDHLDTSYRTPTEVEQTLGIPLLACIPLSRSVRPTIAGLDIDFPACPNQ